MILKEFERLYCDCELLVDLARFGMHVFRSCNDIMPVGFGEEGRFVKSATDTS